MHRRAVDGGVLASIAAGCQRFVNDFVHQRRFAGAGYARDRHRQPERNLHINVFQVVSAATAEAQPVAVGAAADGGDGHAHLAGQVTAGEGAGALRHLGLRAGEDNVAATLAGAGAEVNQVVGRPNDLGVMLYHQHGVAQVAQAFEDFNQAMGVAGVEADGRLVQHVERAHQPRADGGGQLNPLRFPAGQGGGEAIERQVTQADLVQEAQPVADFLQDCFGNGRLRRVQFELVEEVPSLDDAQSDHFSNAVPGHADRPRLFAQARPVAFGAGGVAAITAEENAHVQLVLLALQPGEEAFDAGEVLVACQDFFAVSRFQLAPGVAGGDAFPAAEAPQLAQQVAIAGLGPRFDGAVGQGLGAVGDDAVEVEVNGVAEALAARAGAIGTVEAEQARLRLGVGGAAAAAFETLAEAPLLVRLRVGPFHQEFAATLAVAEFQRVHQPRPDFGADRQAVHQHKDRAVEVYVQQRLGGGKLEHLPVLVEAAEAALAQVGQRIFERAGLGWTCPEGSFRGALLFSLLVGGSRQREKKQNVEAAARGSGENPCGHLVHGVFFHPGAARQAVGVPDAGKQQPEVVVDFGGGGDGGARVAAGVLLLDGDGGGDAFDFIHVRLLDTLQELPGVGGERLDVASLPFGVDGVEGQGRLAGARHAGDDRDGVVENVQMDVFQVVDAGAPDADGVGQGCRAAGLGRRRLGCCSPGFEARGRAGFAPGTLHAAW